MTTLTVQEEITQLETAASEQGALTHFYNAGSFTVLLTKSTLRMLPGLGEWPSTP